MFISLTKLLGLAPFSVVAIYCDFGQRNIETELNVFKTKPSQTMILGL